MLLALILVLSLLAGCSSGGNGGNANQSDAKGSENTSKGSGNGGGSDAPDADIPSWQKEKITLRYASWEDANMERGMLEAFMEKYPNITVVKDESINWPWTDALANAASAGNLPDVFWVEQVPVGVENDWLLDLTPYWDADEETQAVYPGIAEMGVYNGKRLASPTFQFIMGVYVNKTLFEKFNVPLPSYNWTFDEMIDLAKKLSDPSQHYYGIDGPWGDLSFESYLPMINNESFGWNTFDGEKFNFTHPDWIEGYNLKLELRRLKVEENMTGEEKKQVFGDEGAWPTQKGHVAMSIDGSWNSTWLPGELAAAGLGELDFYPYPAGKAGQRVPVILDYIGVASTTKHPEAAYELMKWMSWGKDGWLKRLELNKELNIPVDKLPVANHPEVWSKLENELTMEGMKAAVKLLDKAVPDYGKTLPGLREYNAWVNDEQKITEKIWNGEISPADKAKELEDKINEFVSQAMARLTR